jgi:hypothetical protein
MPQVERAIAQETYDWKNPATVIDRIAPMVQPVDGESADSSSRAARMAHCLRVLRVMQHCSVGWSKRNPNWYGKFCLLML